MSKQGNQIYILALGTLFLVYGLTFFLPRVNNDRFPASINNSKLRVGVFELSEDNKLFLIGIDNSNLLLASSAMNAESLGFQSVDENSFDKIDPRFLILTNKTGVHSIHAYNIGKEGLSKNLRSVGTSEFKFPPTILEAEKIRLQLFHAPAKNILQRILSAVTRVPGEFLGFFRNLFFGQGENDKKRQAAYLSSIIQHSLNHNSFPSMNAAFSDEDLLEIGALLSIKYHKKGLLGGITATVNNRVDLYRTLLNMQRDYLSREMDYLVSRANEEGLILHPLSHRFAVLYADLNNLPNNWNGHRLDLNDPNQTTSQYQNLELNGQSLVPLGVYTVGSERGATQLIDFDNINENRRRELFLHLKEIGEAVQANFIPLGQALQIGLRIARDFIDYRINKSGSTLFSDRLTSYAELAMILETGIARVEIEDVVLESLLDNLDEVAANPFQRAKIESFLTSDDPDERRDGLLALMTTNNNFVDGVYGFTGGEDNDLDRQRSRFDHWMKFINWITRDEKKEELNQKLTNRAERELERRQVRRLASNSPIQIPYTLPEYQQEQDERPVLVFFVDGLRPDKLHKMAAKGIIPTMKNIFIDHGVEFDAFTPNGNTIPSWSTIITGSPPDSHTLRATTNASRDPENEIRSFIDFRVFTKASRLHLEAIESPTFTRIKETRGTEDKEDNWLPGYIAKDKMFQGFMPVHDGKFVPIPEILGTIANQYIPDTLYGVLDPVHAHDLGIAYKVAEEISSNPGEMKMSIQYFGSLDHAAHVGSHELEKGFKILDQAFEIILKAAAEDPVLKNAVVLLASDHGMSGGFEVPDPLRKPLPDKTFFLDNTTFNLHKFFAGDYPGESEEFQFRILSHKPGEQIINGGYFDLFNSGLFKPHDYTFAGNRDNPGKPGYKNDATMIVEPYGDAGAYVFLLNDASAPEKRANYFDLTHHQGRTKEVNIPEALLDYKVLNSDAVTEVLPDGTPLQDHIRLFHELRPVDTFAMALNKDEVYESIVALTGEDSFERDPVLVKRHGKNTGLILSRGEGDKTEFRYFTIHNFDQDSEGFITGSVAPTNLNDPLLYSDPNQMPLFKGWKTDREILELTKDSWYPTAIFALTRNLTLAPSLKDHPKYKTFQAETPDFILFASYGFHFNSHQVHQADHGGLTRYDVKNSLFIHDDQLSFDHLKSNRPVLARDIMPTILDYLGKKDQMIDPQGQSLKQHLIEIREENL